MVNIVCTIVELSISDDSVGQSVLEYFNYVFVTTYIIEAILKVRLRRGSGVYGNIAWPRVPPPPSTLPPLPPSFPLPLSLPLLLPPSLADCRTASVLLLQQVEHL